VDERNVPLKAGIRLIQDILNQVLIYTGTQWHKHGNEKES
jgi:hypothetical protein